MPNVVVNVGQRAIQVDIQDLSHRSGTLYLKNGAIKESKFSLGRAFLARFSAGIRAEQANAARVIQAALKQAYEVDFAGVGPKLSGRDVARLSQRASAANLQRCNQAMQALTVKYGIFANAALNAMRQGPEYASGTVSQQALEGMARAAKLGKQLGLQMLGNDVRQVEEGRAPMTGAQLMSRLREFPNLAELLDKPNTVGGSIGQHTQAVLDQMDDQKGFYNLSGVQAQLNGVPGFEHTNVEQFMKVVLAFHDIGKGIGGTAEQHEHTLPILQKAMKAMGFNEQEVRLASNLVNNDLLGEWQTGKTHDLVETRSRLRTLAQDSGVPMNAYIAMQKLFYISDASSYPHIQSIFMQKDAAGKLHFKPTDGAQSSNLERLLGGLEEGIRADVGQRVQDALLSEGAPLEEGRYPLSLFKDDFAGKAYNVYDLADAVLASKDEIRAKIMQMPDSAAEVRALKLARLDQAVEMATMAADMKADRWTAEHTRGVIEARLSIRAAGISDAIPTELGIGKDMESVFLGEFTSVDELRKPGGVSDRFFELVDRQGGSSRLLNAVGQIQVASSWSPTSMAVKGYLEKNRAVDADAHFYHAQHDQQQSQFERKVSDQYEKFAHAPAAYWDGLAESLNASAQQRIDVLFNGYRSTDRVTFDQKTPDTTLFDKSIQYQMAMQMELLSHMAFPGNDQAHREVVLYRTDSPEVAVLNGFTANDRTRPMFRGSAESASILYPTMVGGNFLTGQRVPYHRVINSFMLAGQHSGPNVQDTARGAIASNEFREVLFMSDGLQSTAITTSPGSMQREHMGKIPLLEFNM
ncbi:MAG TPA: hypothetical protein IAB01_04535 [Candidatus Avidesulfovibrio excrementigallinarum]|nr:hypothetical protein [Candidatus Avidesulfovibrio excrementigallinarum]